MTGVERPLQILFIHNHYQYAGGEDVVFAAEQGLLRRAGHRVVEYVRDNHEIALNGIASRVNLGVRTVWARDSYRELKTLIARDAPDVAHFHNTFPLISPAAYYACRAANIAVVQTLHNPRLLCPAATLFRNGSTCEECIGKAFPWPAIVHNCYRNSRMQTGAVASMLFVHRAIGTWRNSVDAYIVATNFYRNKFIEGGLPAEKIHVKPHFVAPDPGAASVDRPRDYALFVGRLAPEKGVHTLLSAWNRLKHIPLKIRGEGPLLADVRLFAKSNQSNCEILPRLDDLQLTALIQGARFLVWPSEGYYETFGLIAAEAFACGVPVIASRTGVMAEMVQDGIAGLQFTSGDGADLAEKVAWAWAHPTEMESMGRAARAEFESKFTASRNYEQLMNIYASAIAARPHSRKLTHMERIPTS